MNRIEVSLKGYLPDSAGQGLVKDIRDLGISSVSDARVIDVYWFNADLSEDTLETISRQLLADPVTQDYSYNGALTRSWAGADYYTIEVAYNAGVTDPVEASILKALADLGIKNIPAVRTARKYLLKGTLSADEISLICSRLLVNPIVQHVIEGEHFAFARNPGYSFKLEHVDIARNPEVLQGRFGFTAEEGKTVREYYLRQGRQPTDIELETLAQTWSEHCIHKTFRGKIRHDGKVINNLLKTTIMKATLELARPWCLSVFSDNAGVIDFDGRWAVCFKVETHNHPSALEPYGGAATGIGGVIRDPLGTGLGAKPILNTDVFCFGPPDFPYERLPRGVLHPRRVFKGVRAGVADYANRMGIPTLNGAVLFDERYLANPLVYCGTVGILPIAMSQRGKHKPGDLVVLVGGRTGRDGIHGVTFASEKLTEDSTVASYSAVQIGNPIVEKKVIDVLLQARDLGLYTRITDCGGGGLSSAVGEMGAETGVRVDLERVPLKYAGLSHTEIWVSESQERMVLAVPPECLDDLLKLFASEDVEATAIGEFTVDRKLHLSYNGKPVGELDMEFLHEGWPKIEREAAWQAPEYAEPDFPEPSDLGPALLSILGSWNVCSKEWVIRQYDHEVQGGSVLKPLVGRDNDGPGDAAIIRPVFDSERGLIVSNGINPGYGDIDPYWMAASAIDEALRQIIAVGGNLSRVALLDNFCWGDTNQPDLLGALVRAARACHDMSLAYGAPFISGKDSLHNTFEMEGKTVSIPHSLLVSAMAVMDDVSQAVSMDFKQAGDLIYIVGLTHAELGGSEYLKLNGFVGNSVPHVDAQSAVSLMNTLSEAIARGLVRACHDCSEGGIGVALAEMAFAGGLGAAIRLQDIALGKPIEREDYILFSESNSRFLVEVAPEHRAAFESRMKGSSLALVGEVNNSGMVEISGKAGRRVFLRVKELKDAWQRPLRW